MKQNGHNKKQKIPVFVARAERAFKRVAKNVRAENRALKLPIIVWRDGKVVKERA